MHTSRLAEMNAAATRKLWNDEWTKRTVKSQDFHMPMFFTEKTIYIVRDLNNSPFTVTDRTSGMIINRSTIEEAEKAFETIKNQMLSKGWELK